MRRCVENNFAIIDKSTIMQEIMWILMENNYFNVKQALSNAYAILENFAGE